MSHSQKVKSLSNCSPGPCEIIRYGSVKYLSTKPLFQHWGHLTKGLLTSLKKVVLFQYLSLLHQTQVRVMYGRWLAFDLLRDDQHRDITGDYFALNSIQYFGQCIWMGVFDIWNGVIDIGAVYLAFEMMLREWFTLQLLLLL